MLSYLVTKDTDVAPIEAVSRLLSEEGHEIYSIFLVPIESPMPIQGRHPHDGGSKMEATGSMRLAQSNKQPR